MSRAWRGGSSHHWRRIRRQILACNAVEHAGRCQLDVGVWCPRHGRACPGVCTGRATEVHHARGKAAGDDPAHLVACCRACNLHVGDPLAVDPAPRPVSRW